MLFGLYDQIPVLGTIAALPVFAWEMSLAVHLIAKGFRSSPLLAEPPQMPRPAAMTAG